MASNQAVVVDPAVPGRLVIREAELPSVAPFEAIVRVEAISLNRGEIRNAMAAEAGWRPGWDFAGVVESPAADGSGPPTGARVVGMLQSGAWAEWIAAPTRALAVIPSSISFAQAATLPVAGLTALYTLEKGGSLLSRNVLITGASGGVGHFAVQLARNASAHIVGLVRNPDHAGIVRDAGADEVIAGEDATQAAASGPFDHIIESVGGKTLSQALTMLAPGGMCVTFGGSASTESTFDVRAFYAKGGLTLYGFILFHELRREAAGKGLERLLSLMEAGKIRPRIEIESDWTDIGSIAQQLVERRFVGKAVLHVGRK